jgi:hypothetical protein
MLQIFKSIYNEISEDAVRDYVRLGKYSEERNRPILVKFTHALDAANILAKQKNLSRLATQVYPSNHNSHPSNVKLNPYS